MQNERMPFEWINNSYRVNAEMYREVIVGGKKGVITKDMGNYIGVNFYENKTHHSMPCHPTSEVVYLETFNPDPPIIKLSRSKKRYMDYKEADSSLSFREWLGIKTKTIFNY